MNRKIKKYNDIEGLDIVLYKPTQSLDVAYEN